MPVTKHSLFSVDRVETLVVSTQNYRANHISFNYTNPTLKDQRKTDLSLCIQKDLCFRSPCIPHAPKRRNATQNTLDHILVGGLARIDIRKRYSVPQTSSKLANSLLE